MKGAVGYGASRVWVQEKLLADNADCGEVDGREFAPRDACKRNEHENVMKVIKASIADLQ